MAKLYTLFLLLLISGSSQLLCQKQGQARLDSLLAELPKAKDDTNKVNLLFGIAALYETINPKEGKQYAQTSLELSQKLGWKKGISGGYYYLSDYNINENQLQQAMDNAKKALEVDKEIAYKRGIAADLNLIGNIYMQSSEYEKSLNYYFQALNIYEEMNLKEKLCMSNRFIGIVYYRLNSRKIALEYYNKALGYARELNYRDEIGGNLINISLINIDEGNYKTANSNLQEAYKIFEKLGSKSGMLIVLGDLGIISRRTYDYAQAIKYYKMAYTISKEIADMNGMSSNLGNIGLVYHDLSTDSILTKTEGRNLELNLNKKFNLKQSIKFTEEAIAIAEKIKNKEQLLAFYGNISYAYFDNGEYIKARNYLFKWLSVRDTIFKIERTKEIAKLGLNREKELAEKELKIQKLVNIRSRNEKLLLLGGLILFAAIIALIYLQRRRSDKLLLNILPSKIAKRLKKKEKYIADHFDEASIIFIDIVEFSKLSANINPPLMVKELNKIFTIFDKLSAKYKLEKIKTIGDCYMAVAGIPDPRPDHAHSAVAMALDIINIMKGYVTEAGHEVKFRIGLDCGPVIAGVIGERKFIFDLWGDAVNTASRMEYYGVTDKIHCTKRFKMMVESRQQNIERRFIFEERGEIEIKGKGLMSTYFISEKHSEYLTAEPRHERMRITEYN